LDPRLGYFRTLYVNSYYFIERSNGFYEIKRHRSDLSWIDRNGEKKMYR
jgi:hypothetical protein